MNNSDYSVIMGTFGDNRQEPATPEGDERAFNDTLKRMLRTPPDPGRKSRTSEAGQKQKPDGGPVKKRRPAKG